MQTLAQDLRYALRQLARGRVSTVVAVLALALGIGANTSVFTLLNATRLAAAPAAEPAFALTMVVPTLILLVACANIANLLLARVPSPGQKEFPPCGRALGATNARLIQQLLTESVMLSVVAGVVGVIPLALDHESDRPHGEHSLKPPLPPELGPRLARGRSDDAPRTAHRSWPRLYARVRE